MARGPDSPEHASRRLTAKEQAFVDHYLGDGDGKLNATQAAIHAGYSAKTARQIGSENLSKPYIRAVIDAELERRRERLKLTAEEVEERIAQLLRFDPGEAYDPDGKLLPVHQMPPHVRRCLVGHEEEALFETVVTGEGPRGGQRKERLEVGKTTKVRWASPVEATTLAARRFGLLKDKVEHGGKVELEAKREVSRDEWEALAQLRHDVRRRKR